MNEVLNLLPSGSNVVLFHEVLTYRKNKFTNFLSNDIFLFYIKRKKLELFVLSLYLEKVRNANGSEEKGSEKNIDESKLFPLAYEIERGFLFCFLFLV